MPIQLLFLFVTTLSPLLALATQTLTYSSTAKNKKGKIIYFEKHKVKLSPNNDILQARTDYVTESGENLGYINSDFTTSITAPAYEYEDPRQKSKHGIRYNEAGDMILWVQEEGKEEKTETFNKDKWKPEVLLVGCQGLHYYLRKNIAEVGPGFKKKIKLLAPVKLDYFSFRLRYIGETEKTLSLVAEIDSWWLRLFAPKLEVLYDKENGRLIRYEGISNILDEDGDVQYVTIEYDYSREETKPADES